MKMKKIHSIILLLFIITLWAGWQFAFAASENELAIGEVPAEQPPDQKAFYTFKVGDVTFSAPQYFGGGGDGSSTQFRNVYNGDCLRKVDGECFSSKDNYMYFNVYLEVPDSSSPIQEQIKKEKRKICQRL
jgi:hypothetical protein